MIQAAVRFIVFWSSRKHRLSAEAPVRGLDWVDPTVPTLTIRARNGPELALRPRTSWLCFRTPGAHFSEATPKGSLDLALLHTIQGSEPGQGWGSADISWPKLVLFVGDAIYACLATGFQQALSIPLPGSASPTRLHLQVT